MSLFALLRSPNGILKSPSQESVDRSRDVGPPAPNHTPQTPPTDIYTHRGHIKDGGRRRQCDFDRIRSSNIQSSGHRTLGVSRPSKAAASRADSGLATTLTRQQAAGSWTHTDSRSIVPERLERHGGGGCAEKTAASHHERTHGSPSLEKFRRALFAAALARGRLPRLARRCGGANSRQQTARGLPGATAGLLARQCGAVV